MPNLDIYLKENGLLEYSRDLALTQYSTDYTLRLLTKKKYYIVNMNVTTAGGIDTYKKNLILDAIKTLDGYYAYEYQIGPEITNVEFVGDKANIKIAFYLYESRENLENVFTTSVVYLPLLRSLLDRPSDGSVTVSELADIRSRLTEIQSRLADLGYGEVESAKKYNTEYTGPNSIAVRFDNLDNLVNSLNNNIATVEAMLEDASAATGSSLAENLAQFRQTQSDIEDAIRQLSATSLELENRVAEADELLGTIDDLRDAIRTGLSYKLVNSLPEGDERQERVVYVIRDNTGVENNVFTEYMWINGAWEKLGVSRSEIDLTPYELTATVNTKINNLRNELVDFFDNDVSQVYTYAQSINRSLESLTNRVTTVENNKPNWQSTLAGYGITDAYTRTQVDDKIQTRVDGFLAETLNTRLSQLTHNIQDQFDEKQEEIEENRDLIDDLGVELATVRAIAESQVYSLTFDTREDMVAWLKVLPNTDKPHMEMPLGTDLYIRDPNVPDYWIVSKNKNPETGAWMPVDDHPGIDIVGSYYKISEIEVNMSNYYTKSEVYNKVESDDIMEAEADRVNAELATKEDLENKTTVIRDDNDAHTDADVRYSTEGAVKRFGDLIRNEVAEVYATKTALNQEIQNRIDDVNAERDARSEADTTLQLNIDAEVDRATEAEGILQGNIEAEAARATQAEQDLNDRIDSLDLDQVGSDGNYIKYVSQEDGQVSAVKQAFDTTLTSGATDNNAPTSKAAKDYSDLLDTTIRNQLADGTLAPYQAQGVVDFDNGSRIRFTTDSVNKDFEITAVDITDIQAFLSMFEANKYN